MNYKEDIELIQQNYDLLELLEERDRQILTLFYLQNKSVHEISKEFNLCITRVRQLKERALIRLNRCKDVGRPNEMDTRLFNFMEKHNIFTIEALHKRYTPSELYNLVGMGVKTYKRLLEIFDQKGFDTTEYKVLLGA